MKGATLYFGGPPPDGPKMPPEVFILLVLLVAVPILAVILARIITR